MRAELKTDPQHGPGYGLIEIYELGNTGEPDLLIRRMSDGKKLSRGGWRSEDVSLIPERWDWNENRMRIWIGAGLLDNFSPDEHYELTIAGTGSCPLLLENIIQSDIMADTGAGTYAPPPAHPSPPPENSVSSQPVYEGVEPTPEILPDYEPSDMPSGVAAAPPDNLIDRKPPKKRGCLVAGLLLFAVWVGGGWFLWHAAKNAPLIISGDEEQKSFSFEIIPRSTERTYIEDDIEPEKK